MSETAAPRLGAVAIGRNEGERLRSCLESLIGRADPVIYVDSGSTDDSVAMARALGAEVVGLDMTVPFTAARARNAGFARLRELAPDLPYVQFVDGDCEVVGGWLETAAAFLDAHPDVAVVCGRRRERFPEASIYNRLCDIEWDTPVGEAKACGGDALIRAEALHAVGGFRDDLIAGEEPELCVRLRAAGWRVRRLDSEMTLHDAAMTRFGQWWKRAVRAGHAFAEGAHIHGAPPERHWVRESRRIWLWGLAVPLAVVPLAVALSPWFLLLLGIYPAKMLRTTLRGRRSWRDNLIYGVFVNLSCFPETVGQLTFHRRRFAGGRGRLIEYK